MNATAKRANLNPDTIFIDGLRRKIRSNNGHCPNKLSKSPDNKCPCKEYRHEGYCACGMYIATEARDNQIQ